MAAPLLDHHLHAFGEAGNIRPFRPEQVNPASYNLTIGANLKMDRPYGWEDFDLGQYSRERPFMVPPGCLILTDVQEIVRISPSHEAQVILRSSAARAGWDHALAGYVDPGYTGRLTLEFVNCRRFTNLPIYPGLELVQLRISTLDGSPDRHYGMTGRYQHAMQVEANKDPRI